MKMDPNNRYSHSNGFSQKNSSESFFLEDLGKALNCLKQGGIILYPTDTIWGIGCDARNSNAVKRIFALKKRVDSKSMLTLVGNKKQLETIVPSIPEVAIELLEAAVNPLTIIYDDAVGVAPELLADDKSLGIRITNEKFSKTLCLELGAPIVSTSANISGENAPAFFSQVSNEIKAGVDYIVKYNQEDNKSHTPSNIIKLGNSGIFKIIR